VAAAHGGDQVVLDGALETEEFLLVLEVELHGLVALPRAGDAHERVVADPVNKRMQAFFGVDLNLVGLPGAELSGAVDSGEGFLDVKELPGIKPVALEDLVERLALLDDSGDSEKRNRFCLCRLGFGAGSRRVAEEKKGCKQEIPARTGGLGRELFSPVSLADHPAAPFRRRRRATGTKKAPLVNPYLPWGCEPWPLLPG
jgi:hypothetical protein